MFTELPKLFDRRFTIGFALPVAVFLIASWLFLSSYGFGPFLLSIVNTDPLIGTTLGILLVWTLAVFLVGLNHSLYRFLQGYGGWFNPLALLQGLQERRYSRLLKELNALYDKKDANQLTEADGKALKYTERKLASEFPAAGELLPTSFGNAIRAFERYPNKVYKIDGVLGWYRIQPLVPKEFMEFIDDAKAQTDFWVNLWILSFVLFVKYLFFTLGMRYPLSPLVIGLFLLTGGFFVRMARGGAILWGETVKSAFDVYLLDLAKKLGFQITHERDEELKVWEYFNYVIHYRRGDLFPARTGTSSEQKTGSSGDKTATGDEAKTNDSNANQSGSITWGLRVGNHWLVRLEQVRHLIW